MFTEMLQEYKSAMFAFFDLNIMSDSVNIWKYMNILWKSI